MTPYWYAIVSESCPAINTTRKTAGDANDLERKLREDYPDVEVVPMWRAEGARAGDGIPTGYALVPIELTDQMRDAGNEIVANRWLLSQAWKAMLAAAPAVSAPANPWGRADLMATAAVRYCLGRSTYIVGDCVDWLIQQQHAICPAALKIIVRDIREAMQRDDEARERGDQHLPLGMDMDRREWERALGAVQAPATAPGAAE